jgi:hypothetical protein
MSATLWILLWLQILFRPIAIASIDRKAVVSKFNPVRYESSNSTPFQLGNRNFAFGADVTGLQTFLPFNTLSSWGWHNMSLPQTASQTAPEFFTGLDWWTHGRLVNYAQPNPVEPDISTWMIQNPQRINLGRIGFWFGGAVVSEANLTQKEQTLDLWTGKLKSTFEYSGHHFVVSTWVDPEYDTVAVEVSSTTLKGGFGVFFDYPYPTVNKFDAPFVGTYSSVSRHLTSLGHLGPRKAQIRHALDETNYYTTLEWEDDANVSGPLKDTHQYILQPTATSRLSFTINYGLSSNERYDTVDKVPQKTHKWWADYWKQGAFVDLVSKKPSANAMELQRRIILSQYLLAINSASKDPPQESGLVNIGWYGKFHLEMYFWNTGYFLRWGRSSLSRSIDVFKRFLPSSLERATQQGYSGARWGKMTDPSGRSAPGEINSLIIWQQPHPMYFAELQWREEPSRNTLREWDFILEHTADFMASFAWWNSTTKCYDLGPPLYPVSETGNPNITINPTFELAYWRFGLSIAMSWKRRQGKSIPEAWTRVMDSLAPLPVVDGTYVVYEGIPNMWTDNKTTYDHPGMSGIYGLLPLTPGLDVSIARNTSKRIQQTWDFDELYGWDFAMLAMNSLRLGDVDQAMKYLLDPNYQFDDAGYAVGGVRVPTPYMPSSGALLIAVAMMAGGWDGSEGKHFPPEWNVEVEGFSPSM